MAITLTINAVDKSNQIDWQSIEVESVLTKEADSMSFKVKNYGTKTYRPALGDEVILLDGSTKVFGGFIVESDEEVEGIARFYKVVAKDYTQTLDRNLVAKTYTSMTVDDIIADIVATFTTGFTAVNVDCTVVIPKIVFNYLTVSQAIQKIAEQVGNYDWYVDYDKDIHFFNNSIVASPFNLTDTSGNYVFGSLIVHDETHQIRNEIIIRGGEITSTTSRTEKFNGDAVKTTFSLASKFATLPTITVGGIPKTVGIDFLQPDASYQVMWNFNEKYIRFTAGNTPASGTNNIEVTGTPLYPLIFRKQDNASVLLYGVYQYLIVDKTIKTIDAASQRADAELFKYASPTKTASFMTHTAGLIPGQTINIQSTIRGINENYKIVQVKTFLRTPTTLQYIIQLVTADNVGINDILNKLLVKNVTDTIEIDANEVIQRYISTVESVTATDTLNAPTKDSPPYTWGVDANAGTWNFATWG